MHCNFAAWGCVLRTLQGKACLEPPLYLANVNLFEKVTVHRETCIFNADGKRETVRDRY